jgi:SulP family sulfate permease
MEETPVADALAEFDQPGMSELREAVASVEREIPQPGHVGKDALAGLNDAVSSVPDGMASGILAGVNPIYGLYACMVGPIVGGIFSSTRLMVVTTTSAAALGAGQALVDVPDEQRADALFMMVLFIGAFQILFGLLKLGRLTQFVSYSVMTGFIIGIAVLTVLTQLPSATGYEPEGSNRISQTFDILMHPGELHLTSLGLAALAVALAVFLPRTKLGNFGILVAIAAPSLIVVLFGLGSVQEVEDVGEIPGGAPLPVLPALSDISLEVVTAAPAVAVIILVQGAGVSQTVPNPDGSRRSMSRDFIGQGAANVASGLFRGLPVGASLGTTALSVVSGARTRWAAIFAGIWVGVIVVVFPDVIARVAMPTLAALLIVASASTIKPAEAHSLWNTGWPSRIASMTTFLTTLLLPIEVAVGTGVALSAALYVYESANDITLVQLVERPDGRIEERTPAEELQSDRVTVLDVYGHLFFAGARSLERRLPRPDEAERPAVILRLRGQTDFGATLIEVLMNYSEKVEAVGGRLLLTGVRPRAHREVVRSAKIDLAGPVRIYDATSIRGQSTRRAIADAEGWLVKRGKGAPRDEPKAERATADDPRAEDES